MCCYPCQSKQAQDGGLQQSYFLLCFKVGEVFHSTQVQDQARPMLTRRTSGSYVPEPGSVPFQVLPA